MLVLLAPNKRSSALRTTSLFQKVEYFVAKYFPLIWGLFCLPASIIVFLPLSFQKLWTTHFCSDQRNFFCYVEAIFCFSQRAKSVLSKEIIYVNPPGKGTRNYGLQLSNFMYVSSLNSSMSWFIARGWRNGYIGKLALNSLYAQQPRYSRFYAFITVFPTIFW